MSLVTTQSLPIWQPSFRPLVLPERSEVPDHGERFSYQKGTSFQTLSQTLFESENQIRVVTVKAIVHQKTVSDFQSTNDPMNQVHRIL